MIVLKILEILGIIILIFIAYLVIVMFLGTFILTPLSWQFGLLKARIYWKKERPKVCRQLKEQGLTDEEIEQLAPKDFKTFFNMEEEDYDRILLQAEKRIRLEEIHSATEEIHSIAEEIRKIKDGISAEE